MKLERLKEKTKVFFKKLIFPIKWIVIITLGISISGTILLFITGQISDKDLSLSDSGDKTYEGCTVMGINLHGTIITYIPKHAENDTNIDYNTVASESILYSIKQANENDNIKAIVLEIDSTGGYPVAGEEISNAVKNSEKPILGLIRQSGLSAAYWAVSGADRIWASKNSDVGSIGVTQSYLNSVEKNKKDGYSYEQLSSGKFKDSGSANMTLTKEEKDLFMRDINIVYQNFMEAISINRNIPLEEIKKFADGSNVLGEKAKGLGLIDEIGGIDEVEKYLEEQLGEKPEICWE